MRRRPFHIYDPDVMELGGNYAAYRDSLGSPRRYYTSLNCDR